MDLTGRRVLVTGGAGHVGSHLATALVDDGVDVVVLDDLSRGDPDRVPEAATLHRVDVADPAAATPHFDGVDLVFHLAVAEKDVAAGARAQFEANLDVTFGVLEAAVDAGVEGILYTSSSTVYGEAAPRPTPEDHGPLAPISAYGAAKVAEEAVLATAIESAGLDVWVARLANVVGPVFDGSVVPDFVEKLRATPDHLEILGDGRQEKSFIHVDDVVEALVTVVREDDGPHGVYNVGTPGSLSIRRLAQIVSEVLECDPTREYTGGDRGWPGDVPRMELDVSRLRALGWAPAFSCEEAVRRAASQLAAGAPGAE